MTPLHHLSLAHDKLLAKAHEFLGRARCLVEKDRKFNEFHTALGQDRVIQSEALSVLEKDEMNERQHGCGQR